MKQEEAVLHCQSGQICYNKSAKIDTRYLCIQIAIVVHQEKRDTVLNGQPLVSLILGPLVLRLKDEGLKDPGLWPKDRGYRVCDRARVFLLAPLQVGLAGQGFVGSDEDFAFYVRGDIHTQEM